jgi:hypothetical protein
MKEKFMNNQLFLVKYSIAKLPFGNLLYDFYLMCCMVDFFSF